MSKATITFTKCEQRIQIIDRAQHKHDHLVSTLYFDLLVDGKIYFDQRVQVMQPHGSNYATEPLEICPPLISYSGKFPLYAFGDEAENYYRSLVGAGGCLVSYESEPEKMILARNQVMFRSLPTELEMPTDETPSADASGSWVLRGDAHPTAGAEEVAVPLGMEYHENETFEDQEIYLPGKVYINCRFERCRLKFGIEASHILEGSQILDCKIQFTDTVMKAIGLLSYLHGTAAKSTIEGVIGTIRGQSQQATAGQFKGSRAADGGMVGG